MGERVDKAWHEAQVTLAAGVPRSTVPDESHALAGVLQRWSRLADALDMLLAEMGPLPRTLRDVPGGGPRPDEFLVAVRSDLLEPLLVEWEGRSADWDDDVPSDVIAACALRVNAVRVALLDRIERVRN